MSMCVSWLIDRETDLDLDGADLFLGANLLWTECLRFGGLASWIQESHTLQLRALLFLCRALDMS